MANRGISLDNTNNTTEINYPQVDMHTLEEHIVSKVRSEVDSVITTVETRIQDAVLTAIESLVIPSVELAMKSASAFSGQSLDGNVLKLDQRDFSGNVQGLQMTASSRLNSHTDLNKIDETRGNYTVGEVICLSMTETLIGTHTHTHTRVLRSDDN